MHQMKRQPEHLRVSASLPYLLEDFFNHPSFLCNIHALKHKLRDTHAQIIQGFDILLMTLKWDLYNELLPLSGTSVWYSE